MSFGVIQGMIQSQKLNRIIKGERKTYFDGKVGKRKKRSRPKILDKKASPEQLNEIRVRIKKYQKTRKLKIFVLTIIITILIVICFSLIDWSLIFIEPGSNTTLYDTA